MKCLMILEVSQKQAFIFSSTRLKENIANSEAICQVTDCGYYQKIADLSGIPFSEEKNLVYTGGGHIVLEFENDTIAKAFSYAVSKTVKREFPDLILFICISKYNEKKLPADNLKTLSDKLEIKKSIRASVFHQGSFGVEKIDSSLRKPEISVLNVDKIPWESKGDMIPEGYREAKQFEQLGNSQNVSSFIAVVHIDGNAMGKRLNEIRAEYSNTSWEQYKQVMRCFSESVDYDFKKAYEGMIKRVALSLANGVSDKLDLKDNYFPIRKIILAGDDVCFVTEGRIGLEAARIFIEELEKRQNDQDHKGYTACAGVAIVHQKYPFYKAYELAEILCANAKKHIAAYGESGKACAIDWHIEFGELADSIEDLREKYKVHNGGRLELRPYLISAEKEIWEKETIRRYESFKKLMIFLQDEKLSYARGKIKEFREELKKGEQESQYYLKKNLMNDFSMAGYEGIYKEICLDRLFQGKGLEQKIFIKTLDGENRSLYFDAIELLDTFVALD